MENVGCDDRVIEQSEDSSSLGYVPRYVLGSVSDWFNPTHLALSRTDVDSLAVAEGYGLTGSPILTMADLDYLNSIHDAVHNINGSGEFVSPSAVSGARICDRNNLTIDPSTLMIGNSGENQTGQEFAGFGLENVCFNILNPCPDC